MLLPAGASGPIAKIVKQAIVAAPPDSEGEVLVTDEDGEEYLVDGSTIARYVVPDAVPVSLSGVSADIIKIIKQLPLSSSSALGETEVDANEFIKVAEACGCSEVMKLQLGILVPRTESFDAVALIIMLELQEKLKGKVLGSTWPTEPSELGAALKERARSGTFVQLDKAETADESPRLHVPDTEKADHPHGAALKSRSASSADWDSGSPSSRSRSSSRSRPRAVVASSSPAPSA